MELFDYKGNPIFSSAYGNLPVIKVTGTIPTQKSDADIQTVELEYSSEEISFSCYATMKVQGHYTVNYPKKNFNFKLYEDAEITTKKKVKFRNWKKYSKFTLKANYTDFSQSRNIVCSQIFVDMYKARSDYASLPDRVKSSPVAVDGFPVQVYLNGVYYGVYTWNMAKDALFDIDDDEEAECLMMGNSNASNINDTMSVWTDETHDVMPQAIYDAWEDNLSFISDSSDSEFISGVGDRFDLTSVIDQFLLFVLIYGTDNTGNNVMFATYDTEFWYGAMYDMDITCGNPNSINPESQPYITPTNYWPYKENIFFNLYKRVFYNFYPTIKARYLSLRETAFDSESIASKFVNFAKQIPEGLLEKNFAPETGGGAFVGNGNRADFAQALGFVDIRLGFMDALFNTDYFRDTLLIR